MRAGPRPPDPGPPANTIGGFMGSTGPLRPGFIPRRQTRRALAQARLAANLASFFFCFSLVESLGLLLLDSFLCSLFAMRERSIVRDRISDAQPT